MFPIIVSSDLKEISSFLLSRSWMDDSLYSVCVALQLTWCVSVSLSSSLFLKNICNIFKYIYLKIVISFIYLFIVMALVQERIIIELYYTTSTHHKDSVVHRLWVQPWLRLHVGCGA